MFEYFSKFYTRSFWVKYDYFANHRIYHTAYSLVYCMESFLQIINKNKLSNYLNNWQLNLPNSSINLLRAVFAISWTRPQLLRVISPPDTVRFYQILSFTARHCHILSNIARYWIKIVTKLKLNFNFNFLNLVIFFNSSSYPSPPPLNHPTTPTTWPKKYLNSLNFNSSSHPPLW